MNVNSIQKIEKMYIIFWWIATNDNESDNEWQWNHGGEIISMQPLPGIMAMKPIQDNHAREIKPVNQQHEQNQGIQHQQVSQPKDLDYSL